MKGTGEARLGSEGRLLSYKVILYLSACRRGLFKSGNLFHAATLWYQSDTKCPDAVMDGRKWEPRLRSANPSINKSELRALNLQ